MNGCAESIVVADAAPCGGPGAAARKALLGVGSVIWGSCP